jgi:hypothetical protein
MALPAFVHSNAFLLFASLAVLTLAAPWLSKLLERGVMVLLAIAVVFVTFSQLVPATTFLHGLRFAPGWMAGGF